MSQRRHTQVQDVADAAVPDATLAETIDQLAHIIVKLGFTLEKALQINDFPGRILLPYAVQYDLPQVCREILKLIKEYGGSHSVALPSLAYIADRERLTLLVLAVLHGNNLILTILLEDHDRRMEAAGIRKGNLHLLQEISSRMLLDWTPLQSFDFCIDLSSMPCTETRMRTPHFICLYDQGVRGA